MLHWKVLVSLQASIPGRFTLNNVELTGRSSINWVTKLDCYECVLIPFNTLGKQQCRTITWLDSDTVGSLYAYFQGCSIGKKHTHIQYIFHNILDLKKSYLFIFQMTVEHKMGCFNFCCWMHILLWDFTPKKS